MLINFAFYYVVSAGHLKSLVLTFYCYFGQRCFKKANFQVLMRHKTMFEFRQKCPMFEFQQKCPLQSNKQTIISHTHTKMKKQKRVICVHCVLLVNIEISCLSIPIIYLFILSHYVDKTHTDKWISSFSFKKAVIPNILIFFNDGSEPCFRIFFSFMFSIGFDGSL